MANSSSVAVEMEAMTGKACAEVASPETAWMVTSPAKLLRSSCSAFFGPDYT